MGLNSYSISGKDSCRLLLMTATPITEDPMEIIKLINLCKPNEDQIVDQFDGFSNSYLREDGRFTVDGKEKFLNQMAGYVSYLNREKDARQFAQPLVKVIPVPMIENVDQIKALDMKYQKKEFDKEILALQQKIEEENNKIDKEMK